MEQDEGEEKEEEPPVSEVCEHSLEGPAPTCAGVR